MRDIIARLCSGAGDKEASEDYRSAKEILDDCFSTSTASANSAFTVAGTRTEPSDDIAHLTMNQESQIQGGCAAERTSWPCRPTSQERKVRSLVLDTRYNRLLLVKSKMTDAEALKNDIVRTNSLPSSRRRSRFR